MITVEKATARLAGLKAERLPYENKWKDIEDFICPGTTAFYQDAEKDIESEDDAILNTVPSVAHRVLASGMQAGLTSPSRPWFRLDVPDIRLAEFPPVQEWLKKVQDIMYLVYTKSNFYDSTQNLYGQLGGPGTGAMSMFPDFNHVIRCRTYSAGSYWISNDSSGRVDTFAREWQMTTSQMVEEFGYEKCSAAIQHAYDRGDYFLQWKVMQLIEPNRTVEKSAYGWKGKNFTAYWWEGAGQFKRVPPHRRPRHIPDTLPEMADCRQQGLCEISCLDRAAGLQDAHEDGRVRQPWTGSDSGSSGDRSGLSRGENRHTSGRHILLRRTGRVKGTQVPVREHEPAHPGNRGKDRKDREPDKDGIFQRSLPYDLHHGPVRDNGAGDRSQGRRKADNAWPGYRADQSELLDPCIDITFDIALKAGLIPEPPEELEGVPLQVDYISILAQAQKMIGLSAMNELVTNIGSLIQIGKPEALDKLDADQFIDEAARMLGIPPGIIVPDEDVAKVRQVKAQQMAQQEAMAQGQALADGAKSLSETPVGEKSALEALMDMSGGGLM
jgi:hypothetical protein